MSNKQDIKSTRIRVETARIYGHPKDDQNARFKNDGSELLLGEEFIVEEIDHGWARGYSQIDRYKGWVSMNALQAQDHNAPKINAICDIPYTYIYQEPDLKSRPVMRISMMSRLHVLTEEARGSFVHVKDLGWVHARHVSALGDLNHRTDPVVTARKFVHTPYVYGGRTGWGIDCSALVQIALARSGIKIPRDSSDQKDELARPWKCPAFSNDLYATELRDGDLVYFPGHVGMMVDDERMIHAFSDTMRVQEDRLTDIAKHYKDKDGKGIIAIRRPPL